MDQFWTILWSALGTIITGLLSWLTTLLISWLNSKIKDQKLKTFMTKFTELISSCVDALTQTTVNELKKAGKFDKEAAERIKKECIELVKSKLSVDMKKFIEENFGDLTDYISTQIDSFIYKSKGALFC